MSYSANCVKLGALLTAAALLLVAMSGSVEAKNDKRVQVKVGFYFGVAYTAPVYVAPVVYVPAPTYAVHYYSYSCPYCGSHYSHAYYYSYPYAYSHYYSYPSYAYKHYPAHAYGHYYYSNP